MNQCENSQVIMRNDEAVALTSGERWCFNGLASICMLVFERVWIGKRRDVTFVNRIAFEIESREVMTRVGSFVMMVKSRDVDADGRW
jgi:hypothetical protein